MKCKMTVIELYCHILSMFDRQSSANIIDLDEQLTFANHNTPWNEKQQRQTNCHSLLYILQIAY